jgi:hypothetical protein
MRVSSVLSLALALSTSCKSDAPVIDAPLIDARSDAMYACMDYPYQGIRLCPTFQPYCCGFGDYTFCSADSRMGTCLEHPIGGLRQSCDRVTGDGCPADHPICCGIGDITYCSDHAYMGSWQCSM